MLIINDKAFYIYIYIYIYYIEVSVTLGFPLYAFIRVKGFQKRPINMVNFSSEVGCICVPLFVYD